jgi:import inner membrane translocase subunit TIM23
MVYNGINSTIGAMRGKHDMTNSVVAGALSGAIFKSTKGVRPMMISSGIVASVAGAWAVSLRGLHTYCVGLKKGRVLMTN